MRHKPNLSANRPSVDERRHSIRNQIGRHDQANLLWRNPNTSESRGMMGATMKAWMKIMKVANENMLGTR